MPADLDEWIKELETANQRKLRAGELAYLDRLEELADALEWHLQGLDLADALHLAASHHCENLMSFDDKRFARRAQRLQLKPSVLVPMSQ